MTAGARHLNTVHTRYSWHCLLLAGIWGLGAWLAPAQGFADNPASIWYRSSEGCPDGSNFVARVEARGKTARIAVVGDRVDFVVTLGSEASTAHGRLERQTSEGIVAIREVDGTSCEEVADVLAFSLALSDGPPAAEPSRSREADAAALPSPALPVEAAPEAQSAASSSAPAASVPPLSVQPSFIASSAKAGPVGVRAPSKIDPLWLGLLGTGRTAMAPRGAWGAAFGLEQRHNARFGVAAVFGDRCRQAHDNASPFESSAVFSPHGSVSVAPKQRRFGPYLMRCCGNRTAQCRWQRSGRHARSRCLVFVWCARAAQVDVVLILGPGPRSCCPDAPDPLQDQRRTADPRAAYRVSRGLVFAPGRIRANKLSHV